ncbi:MAG: (Fe-S)-binding protein [Desulfobacterales bacterium]|nr:(Fe-S)-binding protein [Desulfobacterales bacterium]
MKADDIYNCGKCGLCLITCPVYKEVLSESISPRAKIQLIRHYTEKGLSSSSSLNNCIKTCLMCGTCSANCPSGVRHDMLFMRMRASMIHDLGDNLVTKAAHHLLCHDPRLRFALKFIGPGRNLFPDILARGFKLGNIALDHLPKFNKHPFRDQVPQVTEPPTKIKGTVLYFTGCGTNYVYEKTGFSTVHILTRMGFRVEIPKEQVCCGLPVFFHGSLEKAKNNILKNIACFNRPDISAIITDCATCGSALAHAYPNLLKELGMDITEAKELSGKVMDISEFLFDHHALLEPLLENKKDDLTVTYHSPCHLRNTQGITTQVEDLLKSLPNITYIKSDDVDSCCGGGGAFFLDHPEVSQKITDKKIQHAKATNAEVWATGCPVCRTVLAGNLAPDNDMKVVHPVELVEMAFCK